MPHRSMPQARVLALGSYGIALTRSCGRLTVATFLALLLGPKVATVEQRLYAWGSPAAHKAGGQRQTVEVTTCVLPLWRWVVAWWARTQRARALDAPSWGARFVGVAGQCRVSGRCHPGRLARGAGPPAGGVAARMVADAAAGAPCHPPRVDRAGVDRPGLVGALALPAHGPPGPASPVADQPGRHVPPCGAVAGGVAPRVGGGRQPAVVRPGDGLCLAGAAGGLYSGGMGG